MANGAAPASAIQPQGPQYVNPTINGIDWSFYPTNPVSISESNPQAISNIQITAAYDFYWCASTFQCDEGADLYEHAYYPIQPLVTVLINDQASQRNLMQAPVPVGSIAGFGQQPYRLIMPRVFMGTANIVFTWQYYGPSMSGPTYDNMYFTLHGFQVPHGQPLTFLGD